jgi:hypothetical protein
MTLVFWAIVISLVVAVVALASEPSDGMGGH